MAIKRILRMRAIPVKTIELKGTLRVREERTKSNRTGENLYSALDTNETIELNGHLPSWWETNESNELKRTVRVSEIPTKKSNKRESFERSRC